MRRQRPDASLLLLASLNLVLIAAWLVVRLWPLQPLAEPPRFVDPQVKELVRLEDVPQTTLGVPLPPPVVPLPPIVVPDDRLLEEEPIPLPDPVSPSPMAGSGPVGSGPAGRTEPLLVEEAEVSPQPIRVVEPEYPPEARRRRIRAEIIVRVLVDEKGRVSEPVILRRLLYGRQNIPQEVERLGYGLEEAALNAALRWLFRPAEHRGERVQTYTVITFQFGQ
ncbi:MAG: energy transducer TonB [Bacteroidota bacterium]|nr:energy transducer TonB [Bacteroidota bacterium]MDW8286142.1 energy transducer TonB [Bacteroidota bacterium]